MESAQIVGKEEERELNGQTPTESLSYLSTKLLRVEKEDMARLSKEQVWPRPAYPMGAGSEKLEAGSEVSIIMA